MAWELVKSIKAENTIYNYNYPSDIEALILSKYNGGYHYLANERIATGLCVAEMNITSKPFQNFKGEAGTWGNSGRYHIGDGSLYFPDVSSSVVMTLYDNATDGIGYIGNDSGSMVIGFAIDKVNHKMACFKLFSAWRLSSDKYNVFFSMSYNQDTDAGRSKYYTTCFGAIPVPSTGKPLYYGNENSIARKVEKIYFGDSNDIARKVKKIYYGDSNGIARLVFENGGGG